MIKLIKLELEKNRLITYVITSLLILVFGVGFCFLAAYIPKLELIRSGVSLPADMVMKWGNFISLISVLFVLAFSVLSAVMHTKFTIEEYIGKSAILLFSYPVKRSKILVAKCSLVFFFTIFVASVCIIVSISIFAFFSNTFHILPNLFTSAMWPYVLITAGVSALLAGAIGLVAMRIGFWQKSMVVTVVTSFLLSVPFGNIVSVIPNHSLEVRLIGMIVLLAIGFAVFWKLSTKVNKMEAL